MFVLITGVLWRDPVTRQSKAGTQYVTASLRAGTATEAQWANVIVFDAAAQSDCGYALVTAFAFKARQSSAYFRTKPASIASAST
jgi:hypothetical protein